MIIQQREISGKHISQVLSGVTIIILISASYALFMFWTSINNYQSAVNITSTVENRLLAVQSKLNRQAQIWNTLNFEKLNHRKQQQVWEVFNAHLADIQSASIEVYSDMDSSSTARSHVSKFLALYGDINRQYQRQKTTMMLSDIPGPSSRQKLSAMLETANHELDQAVALLHGRVSNMTSDNREFIDNGSTASIISFSLSATTLLFLFATLYYRMRIV